MTDIVLINPGDRKQVFQELGKEVSAIEPPFWVAVLAAYLRKQGFRPAIIDANAENITPEETARRVGEYDPLLAAVIVYGSQPSASTQNMTIAGRICTALKENTNAEVAIGGLHPSALPERTLREEDVDFVIDGEGPLTLEPLLRELQKTQKGTGGKKKIKKGAVPPGLWWYDGGEIRHTDRAPLIADLDEGLPVAAWDLLPMETYRAHNWHCFDNIDQRKPYGALYTSLGCPFKCSFCCINAPFGKPGIRYRSPELVLEEIELLVTKYGVKNLKIVDELFILSEAHYVPILEGIVREGWDLNIWAYARVDTIKPEHLPLMKQAGIHWLALGIESANANVRGGVSKLIRKTDVETVVEWIRGAGIYIIGNYIFGLPDDTLETMRETLDMAKRLNCEFANLYSAMAYPGSRLYDMAVERGLALPGEWHGFSQHSYEALPLPTKYVSAAEVLTFRDDAFHEYYANPVYLDMLERKFGREVREHISEITKKRLKRKILAHGTYGKH